MQSRSMFTCLTQLAVLASALTAAPALAFDLKAPYELENAMTLPGGVRNPRFRLITFAVEDKFDGFGISQPLAKRLNKTVTWGDLINAQKTDADKASIQGVLEDPGSGISDSSLAGSPGATTGEVNTAAQIMVPVFAIGLTDNLTAAVALPIVKVDISAATGFDKSEDGQKFIDAACATNPEKCNDAANKLNDAIGQKLANNGYLPVQSETINSIGDARLVTKYRAYKDDLQSVVVKAELTAPTGTPPNVDKAVDVPTGDGQWDAGMGVSYDRALVQDLRWNVFGSYVAQLPDEIERRLPNGPGDTISSIKETLNRDLGDIIQTGTSMNYTFPSAGVTVGAGYSFQYVTSTRYKDGKLASAETYQWLEDEMPLQALHAATFAANFSTVEWFKAKRFVLPFQANLVWSLPIEGRNVTNNSTVAGELVLFF